MQTMLRSKKNVHKLIILMSYIIYTRQCMETTRINVSLHEAKKKTLLIYFQ